MYFRQQKSAGFHCGDSVDPVCTVYIPDNAVGRTLVASFETGYLMPVFRYLGIDTDGDGVVDPQDADDDNDGGESVAAVLLSHGGRL